MKCYQALVIGSLLLALSFTLPAYAQSQKLPKPELIRDTATAEGTDTTDTPAVKERNPKLAQQSIDIGNFYLKRRNYVAAIERYREALEYQSDSIQAFEALANAYEKNGEIAKAVSTYKSCIDKNPNSAATREIRIKLARLEKKSN
jgi:tetratricopeptide (TPR) repeat protein